MLPVNGKIIAIFETIRIEQELQQPAKERQLTKILHVSVSRRGINRKIALIAKLATANYRTKEVVNGQKKTIKLETSLLLRFHEIKQLRL